MLIYIITNDINNKVYIGQTAKQLNERIDGHRSSMIAGVDTHIYRAMRKYGWDKFHFTVLEDNVSSKEKLDELEKFYIQKYDSVNHGYNMTFGGDENAMNSPCVKYKHDNIMRSDEVRHKISESMKASYAKRGGPSADHRKHLSESKKRIYSSTEGEIIKEKFRNSFSFTPKHYAALNDSKNKAVYCVNEGGEVVASFNRVKDAAIWWLDSGYKVKHYDQLCDKIKESYVQDKYIRGLKWKYRA